MSSSTRRPEGFLNARHLKQYLRSQHIKPTKDRIGLLWTNWIIREHIRLQAQRFRQNCGEILEQIDEALRQVVDDFRDIDKRLRTRRSLPVRFDSGYLADDRRSVSDSLPLRVASQEAPLLRQRRTIYQATEMGLIHFDGSLLIDEFSSAGLPTLRSIEVETTTGGAGVRVEEAISPLDSVRPIAPETRAVIRGYPPDDTIGAAADSAILSIGGGGSELRMGPIEEAVWRLHTAMTSLVESAGLTRDYVPTETQLSTAWPENRSAIGQAGSRRPSLNFPGPMSPPGANERRRHSANDFYDSVNSRYVPAVPSPLPALPSIGRILQTADGRRRYSNGRLRFLGDSGAASRATTGMFPSLRQLPAQRSRTPSLGAASGPSGNSPVLNSVTNELATATVPFVSTAMSDTSPMPSEALALPFVEYRLVRRRRMRGGSYDPRQPYWILECGPSNLPLLIVVFDFECSWGPCFLEDEGRPIAGIMRFYVENAHHIGIAAADQLVRRELIRAVHEGYISSQLAEQL